MAPGYPWLFWPAPMFRLELDNMLDELEGVQLAVDASEQQIKAAYWKALQRTRNTMRNTGARAIRDAIGLRRLKRAKSRFQVYTRSPQKYEDGLAALKLWIGLDPVKVHDLKGRIKNNKRKNGIGSATFRGVTYQKSWKARLGGKTAQTIYHREGQHLRVQGVEIEVQLDDVSQDLFDQTLEKFEHHFNSAIKSDTFKHAAKHARREEFFR